MLNIYKNNGIKLDSITQIEPDCWIHLEDPTKEEMMQVFKKTQCHYDFLSASLDLEEMPRLEREDNQYLIVVNVVNESFDDELNLYYDTVPLGVVILDDYVITIAPQSVSCINNLVNRNIRIVSTLRKNKLLIQIMYYMAQEYLKALQKIDKISLEIEQRMTKSPDNKAIVELLSLEKTLVYFKSALRSNESVLKKLNRFQWVHRFEDDSDLLEDTLIEINQGIDMTDINIGVIVGLREAFSSLISNNLNNTMKILASVTILLTVPTMIFSFYGINLNLEVLPAIFQSTGFVSFFSVCLTAVIYLILKRKNML
ncbi:magnesium transporter CorA family protein [Erysipelotrichaceae bacterium OttesenSCG-928-M19]|nr:magnesium transporter CorA family protein [Erysipelotrichaceae bacterium OttesenSCG-928-M19]